MIDLEPAAERMAALVSGTTDDQLDRPTPCPDLRVGDLIDHVGMFAARFRDAAHKTTGDRSTPPPTPDLSRLEPGWRDRIRGDLRSMAAAWGEPEAWEGVTLAGAIEMPADVVALVAIDELVVHAWDLAVATGRPFDPDPAEIDAALAFVGSFEAPRDGSLFGPVVAVPAPDAPIERLLGLTGRDPGWRPAG
jgi:uncharacterized protein (TIGR03086 family)